MSQEQFFDDLTIRRGNFVGGQPFPTSVVELNGGSTVHLSAFEPDPATFREDYYYNTKTNVLYKKLSKTVNGFKVASWSKVSQ